MSRIEIVRRSREKNRERYNEQSRAYVERNPEKRRESVNAWRGANRLKRRAHRMVEYALSKGRIERKPCADCGAEKSQAHHDDYEKPLEVKWLCAACHGKRHRAA